MDDAAARIAQRAADIDAALAVLPDVKVPYEPVRSLPPGRLRPNDAPMSFEEASRVTSFRVPNAPTMSAADAEKAARSEWNRGIARCFDFEALKTLSASDRRLALVFPQRFAWVRPSAPDFKDLFRARLPWFTRDHLDRLRALWESGTNLLISGPVGLGKTTLAVLHARWTLSAATYDTPSVKMAREKFEAWRADRRVRHAPRAPDELQCVQRARHMRFVASRDLLDTKQKDLDEEMVWRAKTASALYLDEIGEELSDAKRGSYVVSTRGAAVESVVAHRWNIGAQFVCTSKFGANELLEMYQEGPFRRLVEDRSGAVVVDLTSDTWAGAYYKTLVEREKRVKR